MLFVYSDPILICELVIFPKDGHAKIGGHPSNFIDFAFNSSLLACLLLFYHSLSAIYIVILLKLCKTLREMFIRGHEGAFASFLSKNIMSRGSYAHIDN